MTSSLSWIAATKTLSLLQLQAPDKSAVKVVARCTDTVSAGPKGLLLTMKMLHFRGSV